MTTQHDSDSDAELVFEDAVEDIAAAAASKSKPGAEADDFNKAISTDPSSTNQERQEGVKDSATSETPTPERRQEPEVHCAEDDLSGRLASVALGGSSGPEVGGACAELVHTEGGREDEEMGSSSDSDGGFDEATMDEFLKEATGGKEGEGKEGEEEKKEKCSPREDGTSESEGEEEELNIDENVLMERDASLTEEEKEELKGKAQNYKTEGNRLFKEGNYLTSIEEYTSALQTCPLCFPKERAIMYSNRGAAKLHLEKYDAAIEDCTHAVELNPVYMKALVRRAELYEKTDKLDEALSDHAKVLELDPAQHASRQACLRLPEQIKIRNEKMKDEMMGKLKDLGNMILKPFGLSTNNFQMQQDPNSGGYSVKFQQNQPQRPAPQPQ